MVEVITAVYEKGVLRPLRPLNLPEHETVQIQLLPKTSTNEEAEAIRLFVQAGLMPPAALTKQVPPPAPMSEKERRELADMLGKIPGKPLSEIVIEERGEL